MNKIDDILDKLKMQQPSVTDEEAFIDSIMDSLPDLNDDGLETKDENPETDTEKTSPLIIMLRTLSSLAATFLIGLFIFLNVSNKAEDEMAQEPYIQINRNSSYYSEMSKCTTPKEAMKQYAEKKQRNINNLISLYHEKNM